LHFFIKKYLKRLLQLYPATNISRVLRIKYFCFKKGAFQIAAYCPANCIHIYAYGCFFKNREDGGCFGAVPVLNTSFIFTLIRNAVMLYMLINIRKNGRGISTENVFCSCYIAILCPFARFTIPNQIITIAMRTLS
jgi:hypothetical protein